MNGGLGVGKSKVGALVSQAALQVRRWRFGDSVLFARGKIPFHGEPIQYGLLEVDDCAIPSSPEDVECLKHFRLTETGEYYLDEFRNYYEYLVYMKDDVELNSIQISKYGIRDCIKVESLKERYDDVSRFLELLYNEEKNFLVNLNKNQRRVFIDKFVGKEGVFLVVSKPIEMQIKFGEARRESADISEDSIQRLYSLKKEIDAFSKEYEDYGKDK